DRRTAAPDVREIEETEATYGIAPGEITFEIDESDSERVIDDDDTGEMFKDAFLQEAIVDKVRAVEFDMESTSMAKVGSLIDSVNEAAGGFERIADEEEAETAPPAKGKGRKKTTKASS